MNPSVFPTSRDSAECEPIVLRETCTTRLLFIPLLVNNPNCAYACVKGRFLFQRRSRSGSWENVNSLRLNTLRMNEYVQLSLHSQELKKLVDGVQGLYHLHEQEGIPATQTRYLVVDERLGEIAEAESAVLDRLIEGHSDCAPQLLGQLLTWAADSDSINQAVELLNEADIRSLQKLNSFIGVERLARCLEIWRDNRDNRDEGFWQELFSENAFVLSQVFPYPLIIIKERAYVGGKSVENIGGQIVDFLCSNSVTQNAALIEIKTPMTPLLGSEYRGNVYSISAELSGSIAQVTSYRHQLQQEYRSLRVSDSIPPFDVFEPQCVVVVGDFETQINDRHRRKSLELFRRQLRDVQVVTYDELFGRVQELMNLFEGADEGT